MKLRKIHLYDYSKAYQKRLLNALTAELEIRYPELQKASKLVFSPTGTLLDRSIEDIKAEVKSIIRRGGAGKTGEKLFSELKALTVPSLKETKDLITLEQWRDFKLIANKRNSGDRTLLNKLIHKYHISVEELREFLTSEDNVPIFEPPSPRLQDFIDSYGFSPMVARFMDHFGIDYTSGEF